MRSSFLALCGLALALAATLHGQARWDFTDGIGNPSTLPSNITSSALSAGNGGTLAFNNTSASGTYSGASGGNNASVTARTGVFSSANSTYFEVTLTAAAGHAVQVSSVSVGTRSTGTGPVTLALYTSANDFSTALGTTPVPATSTWTLATIPGSTSPALARPTVTLRLYGFDGSGNAGAGNWRIDDLSINATAITAPVIVTPPESLTVVSADPVVFTVTATGTGTLSYQWRKNGTPITGNPSAQTATLNLGNVTTAAAGSYDVVVTDTLASITSSPATLTVNKATATITLAPQTVTYNGTPRSVIATTSPKPFALVYSYTATTGTTYGPSSVPPTNAGTYTVTATVDDPEYQGVVTVPNVFTIAKAPATVALGNLTATYDGLPHPATVATTPPGISTSITYTGSGTPTTSTPPTAAGSYAVVATINHQNYTGSTSGTLVIAPAAATITLGSLAATFNGTPLTPAATTNPPNQPVTFTYTGIGGTVYGPSTTPPTNAGTYSVSAALTSSGNYTAAATGTFTIAPAAQTITFAPPPDRLASSAPFALTATSSSGLPVTFTLVSGSPDIATLAGSTLTLTGATGTVTIRATQPGDANHLAAADVVRSFQVVASATPPTFLVPPADTTGFIGQSVALTAHVSGAPTPQFQWRKNGVDLPGATDSTLQFLTPALTDSGLYQLLATNIAGTAQSLPVFLEIKKRPQTISFAAPATLYPPGTSIPLTATSTSGLPVTLALVSGAGSLAANILVGSGGDIVIRATQPGNDTFDAAEPVERTFTIVAGALSPAITTPLADQTVTAGANVTFRATAVGTPAPAYQWQKDGADLPGATIATLTLPAVTVADTGRYTLIATNALGSARTTATLTVRAPPAILTHPENQTVLAGATVTFSVVASGSPSPSYQWRRNGTALAGATHATLALANVTTANAGRYDVIVANPLGTLTSNPATLTVNTRDFTGTYLGTFTGNSAIDGDFALHVRANGTAIFLGHLPGLQTGLATLTLRIEPSGTFSLGLVTLAGTPDLTLSTGPAAPLPAAAPRPVTLTGTLDSETDTLSGNIPELSATFTAARRPATGPASARAGLYQLAAVGSASGRGYAVVAPDGETFLLTTDGAALDSARGTLTADGRFTATSTSRATVDLSFTDNAITGTARTSAGATVSLAGSTEALAGTEHLVNLSVRAITSNAAPLITGFVVTGSTPKQLLIRAAGPAIAAAPFNVPGALADPTIQVFRGNAVVAQNDEWGTPAANVAALNAATTRVGAFPFRAGSADAALFASLAPGAYTVLVGGGNGATLAEIYEVLDNNEAPGARRLVNLSARGLVAPNNPLIAGLVIGGTAPQRVLIRGIGPTLGTAPFNVAGALPNPQLTLFRGTTALRTNDDWFRDTAAAALIRDAATRAGAFALPAQSLDAALLLFLEPGAYTVQLTAPPNAPATAATGIALIEIYESPL